MTPISNAQPSSRLSALLAGLAPVNDSAERAIGALSLDSRTVQPGTLFLACAGGSGHGLSHVQQAVENGAVAVLWEPDAAWQRARVAELAARVKVPLIPVEGLGRLASEIAGRFYDHPSRHMHVVGFTGTNGKTSCSQFLAQALMPNRCAIIGTLGYGFPGALQAGSHTTPDPVALQSILHGLRSSGAESVAMEVSSHALDQGRAAAIHFNAAVFTNLSRDHLDYHGSMADYADSKRQLFQIPDLGCVVLNLDDPFGQELLAGTGPGVTRIGYGLKPIAAQTGGLDGWLGAQSISSDESGMRIALQGSWGAGELVSSLLGHFNASNLLAVLAVLLHLDLSLQDALGRLAGVRTVAGRMQHFGGGDKPLVVIDYAHTPDALQQVLTTLRLHTRGRLVCVFGCGGDRDRGKRPQMGEIAEALADEVYVTDDNPRREDGGRIVREILGGMKQPAVVRVERDRAHAIHSAVAQTGAGDLVLVAGKGHEDYQLVNGQVLAFSDAEQVQSALRGTVS